MYLYFTIIQISSLLIFQDCLTNVTLSNTSLCILSSALPLGIEVALVSSLDKWVPLSIRSFKKKMILMVLPISGDRGFRTYFRR